MVEANEGRDESNQSEEADGSSQSSEDSSDIDDSHRSQGSEGYFDTDEDDEGEESTDDDDSLDAVDAEEDALRCRLRSDLDPPPSCFLRMKPIVTCLMCLEAVPKAVYFFHLMKFHAKAPCLDEAPALFADFLPPGCDVDADDSEVEEEEVLGEQEKEDEAEHSYESGSYEGSDGTSVTSDVQEEDDSDRSLESRSHEGSDGASEEPNYDGYCCPELKKMLVECGFDRPTVNKLLKAQLIETLEANGCPLGIPQINDDKNAQESEDQQNGCAGPAVKRQRVAKKEGASENQG